MSSNFVCNNCKVIPNMYIYTWSVDTFLPLISTAIKNRSVKDELVPVGKRTEKTAEIFLAAEFIRNFLMKGMYAACASAKLTPVK